MCLSLPSSPRNLTRRALFRVCMAGFGMPACADMKNSTATYGAKVKYSQGATIHYPDFDLTYIGTRKEASKVYPRGFTYEDFRVERGSDTVTVSWSSGTGLIAPRQFEFGGQKYQLMLVHGGPAGKLKDHELVVSKA